MKFFIDQAKYLTQICIILQKMLRKMWNYIYLKKKPLTRRGSWLVR